MQYICFFQFETFQDRFWKAKVGHYFYIQNTMHIWVSKECQELYLQNYFA